jgi:hypothetical protein
MDNYMLRVLESANQTISISSQTMEQQKILYTHKHCEIIHIRNVVNIAYARQYKLKLQENV